jgi:hypothetical protein
MNQNSVFAFVCLCYFDVDLFVMVLTVHYADLGGRERGIG